MSTEPLTTRWLGLEPRLYPTWITIRRPGIFRIEHEYMHDYKGLSTQRTFRGLGAGRKK